GIEHLESARWADAVAALTRALEADGDNAGYVVARGVAHTLAERFPQALTDLQRAGKLRNNFWEARLWLATAYRMSGDPAQGARHFLHGDMASKDYASLVYNEMAMEYWQSKFQGQFYDAATRMMVLAAEPVRRKFAEAATWFARRAKSTGAGQDLSSLLF